jgi:hypothetical protein
MQPQQQFQQQNFQILAPNFATPVVQPSYVLPANILQLLASQNCMMATNQPTLNSNGFQTFQNSMPQQQMNLTNLFNNNNDTNMNNSNMQKQLQQQQQQNPFMCLPPNFNGTILFQPTIHVHEEGPVDPNAALLSKYRHIVPKKPGTSPFNTSDKEKNTKVMITRTARTSYGSGTVEAKLRKAAANQK